MTPTMQRSQLYPMEELLGVSYTWVNTSMAIAHALKRVFMEKVI